MVNVHFSLLPPWRGAAPVERAILAGDSRTGVCLMELEEGLDTGPVYACEALDIGADETADDLRDRLVTAGVALLVDRLATGLGEPQAQQGEPTYAAKLDPAELEIDWSRPAVEILRLVAARPGLDDLPRPPPPRAARCRCVGLRSAAPPPGASSTGPWSATGDGNRSSWSRCSPRAAPRQSAAAWRNGAHLRRARRSAPDGGHRRAGVALRALERIDQGAYANLVLPPLLEQSGLERRRPRLRHGACVWHDADAAGVRLADRPSPEAFDRRPTCDVRCGWARTSCASSVRRPMPRCRRTVALMPQPVARLRQRRSSAAWPRTATLRGPTAPPSSAIRTGSSHVWPPTSARPRPTPRSSRWTTPRPVTMRADGYVQDPSSADGWPRSSRPAPATRHRSVRRARAARPPAMAGHGARARRAPAAGQLDCRQRGPVRPRQRAGGHGRRTVPAGAPRPERSRAGRRTVLRARRAAPPARRPLARREGRSGRPGPATARTPDRGGRAW